MQHKSLGQGLRPTLEPVSLYVEGKPRHYIGFGLAVAIWTQTVEEEIREMREELQRYKSMVKRQGTQGEPAGGDGRLEEGYRKKKLDQRKKASKEKVARRCEVDRYIRKARRRCSKKSVGKNCKILSKGEMI